jgi:crossover junction endodeoxyribonuclease RuvC
VRVVGLDLSLVATGVADESGTRTLSPKKLRGVPRLAWFHTEIIRAVEGYEAAVIEGYSFGSQAGREVLGELGGIARLAIYQLGVMLVVIPPKLLKKYVTGSGNAGKDEVIAAAIRNFGFEGISNNEADAYMLRCMARDWINEEDVSKERKSLLTKLEWAW